MGKGQTPVTEQKQGIELVDAAVHHEHVKQFVYTSADRGGAKSSSDPTNIPHFISKYHIEKHLIQKAHGSNMGYTIFRPVAFMDNMSNDFPGMICLVHVLLRCVCLIVEPTFLLTYAATANTNTHDCVHTTPLLRASLPPADTYYTPCVIEFLGCVYVHISTLH